MKTRKTHPNHPRRVPVMSRRQSAAADPDQPQEPTQEPSFDIECGPEHGHHLNGKKLKNGRLDNKSKSGGLTFDHNDKEFYLSFHNNPGLKESWETHSGEKVPEPEPDKEKVAE